MTLRSAFRAFPLFAIGILAACSDVPTQAGPPDPPVGEAYSYSSVPIPAFPGAEGWGATALNTCRSKPLQVLAVTNLNSTGPGSLRQAITDIASDRFTVIIFRTGGRIRTSEIRLDRSCVYIAGQTAPGDGVVIEGQGMGIAFRGSSPSLSDVVIRYLRFRGRSGVTSNNFIIYKGKRIILDHNSFSWTDNYVFAMIYSSYPISDISIQRSIIAEAFAKHPTGAHLGSTETFRYAPFLGMTNVSFHRNLFANNSHRNPNSMADNALFANNVIYNWFFGAMQLQGRGTADFVNNFGKAGPMTDSRYSYMVNPVCNDVIKGYSIYAVGNLGPRSSDPNGNNWSGSTRQVTCYNKTGGTPGAEVPSSWRRSSPQAWASVPFPVRVLTATDAFTSVLNDVGANARIDCDGRWLGEQDPVDARLISQTRTGTGPYTPPLNEGSAGGYPSYYGGTSCQDSDNDGLPNAWEQRFFGSATSASAAAFGRNGYLLIEHYVNGTDPR